MIVKDVSFELSDPTVSSQVIECQASGADTFYNAGYPNMLSYISQSIPTVLRPAGLENAIGIISGQFSKDPTDSRWAEDPSTKEYNAWLQKYIPGGNPEDIFLSAGYAFIQPLIYLLEQCGDDLSHENIMRQATSFHDVAFPWLLPGVTISTSPTHYQPIKTLRETRFNGKSWDLLEEPN